jgi:hypothetical protein
MQQIKEKEGGKSLRQYGIGRKFAGSRPDELNEFLSIHLNLPVALDPGYFSTNSRNKYQRQK